jgi:hypothetical protein
MENIIFDETSEEYKAIKWLKNKTTNYSDDSLVLHYNNILYYLIINLMKKNKKLEEKIPSIILNNNYKWTLIEKGKDGVCVNYKLEKVDKC